MCSNSMCPYTEALDILQLRPLQGRMIGGAGTANGLSPGQRRILTVAVEVVSNAPVFFLVGLGRVTV